MSSFADSSVLAFIGSYADRADPGLYTCRFDPATGRLELIGHVSGLQNPTFLAIDESRFRLYALDEAPEADGVRQGAAAAYAIDPATGTLEFMNKQVTVPAPTCHIALDFTRQCLVVSSYHGGMVGLSPVLADGTVGEAAEVRRHSGSSVLPVQSQPRPHSAFFDPSGRFAVVPDLGMDQIVVYRVDAANRRLVPHGSTPVAAGAGPRHFAFHPSLPCGYVINELNATITAFRWDGERGQLSDIGTISTLPDSYQGDNACADIHLSPDGRFLYGSNRGHDSIAVFAVSPQDGALSLVEHAPSGGGHPRNFALSPDGRFLLAANRDSNNIVVFSRDADTGRLRPAGHTLELSKPVCIQFLPQTEDNRR